MEYLLLLQRVLQEYAIFLCAWLRKLNKYLSITIYYSQGKSFSKWKAFYLSYRKATLGIINMDFFGIICILLKISHFHLLCIFAICCVQTVHASTFFPCFTPCSWNHTQKNEFWWCGPGTSRSISMGKIRVCCFFFLWGEYAFSKTLNNIFFWRR